MMKATRSNKQVRFSNRSLMAVVENLSLSPHSSDLWYSQEETDLFKAWLSHRVSEVRSQLGDHIALLDEESVTINAAAILGLEKYLSPELTVEYKDRRLALQRAVLEEHRWHRALRIPHAERLAMVSTKHSQWARERARAAALFLEQDVMQDFREMNLQAMVPRRSSMPLHEADTTEEKNKANPFLRRWSSGPWSSGRSSV
mmetsp:Transcript_18668/g.30575  ORF Transcript_18668/g.30575 Transcript_18668/m.30575 type:complete len:201 (-) Transcript_18668:166-768(-)